MHDAAQDAPWPPPDPLTRRSVVGDRFWCAGCTDCTWAEMPFFTQVERDDWVRKHRRLFPTHGILLFEVDHD
jgi:hypothetical protein